MPAIVVGCKVFEPISDGFLLYSDSITEVWIDSVASKPEEVSVNSEITEASALAKGKLDKPLSNLLNGIEGFTRDDDDDSNNETIFKDDANVRSSSLEISNIEFVVDVIIEYDSELLGIDEKYTVEIVVDEFQNLEKVDDTTFDGSPFASISDDANVDRNLVADWLSVAEKVSMADEISMADDVSANDVSMADADSMTD